MQSFRKIVLETGIAAGLLFIIHASFPNVNSWPMIWPALAGAAAFWLATREPEPHRWRRGLTAALATGALTGAIAAVGLSIMVYVILHTNILPSVREAAGQSKGLISASSMLAFLILGAIDFVVAFVAGLLMWPVRYFQTRHVHA
ncbi:MAG TPA: hypothetical protein VGN65_00285 [Casimicrobiaceae bacterium]|jgi:hypothetical protein